MIQLKSFLARYYMNTNEIPGELFCEIFICYMISSYVKITCYLHMWNITVAMAT